MTMPETEPPVYPLSLRLDGRRAVVVGGGAVALRRVAGLRAGGASVLVVAPAISPTLNDLSRRALITVRERGYEPGDLDGAWLVFACTDNPEVNAAVAADAERQRIWCVRADDAVASAAWVPAVGRSGPVTVAVNAGRNPRRAAALRDRCVAAVEAAGRVAEPDDLARDGSARGGSARGGSAQGSSARGGAARDGSARGGSARRDGLVSIVGGGPGDPGLITVAGLRRLREADVVVADRLAPQELLEELAPDVHVIDAAKVPGGPAMRQDQINHALVEHARAGRAVVRLKGGDPFVFGRGREEVEACLAAGVPVAVIPGVTSAISVPAAAGIPVTHRGLSQGFCVLAGHVRPGDPRSSVDWAALARSGMTLVLLMAVEHLAAIADNLLAAGLSAQTPSAAISDGWTRNQRVVTAPLPGLAAAVAAAGLTNPAVIVIGDVAQLAPAPGTLPAQTAPASGSADTPYPGPAAPGGHPAGPGAAAPFPSATSARRVLVLGGARSGKSVTAEQMLAVCDAVDYLAAGAPAGSGDDEWDARVREHQERRPGHWRTVETLAIADVLAAPDGAPVLVDCLTTWLARVMDECGAWDGGRAARRAVQGRVDHLLDAWRRTRRHVVAVSNEIGSGVVPETSSGRLFRDELGRLNARIAAASDEVWLCTAGIARRLQ